LGAPPCCCQLTTRAPASRTSLYYSAIRRGCASTSVIQYDASRCSDQCCYRADAPGRLSMRVPPRFWGRVSVHGRLTSSRFMQRAGDLCIPRFPASRCPGGSLSSQDSVVSHPNSQDRRLPEKHPPRLVEAPGPWRAKGFCGVGSLGPAAHRPFAVWTDEPTAALRWAAARQGNKQARTVAGLRQSAERTSTE
jgi:hypothetical protein